LVVPRGKRKLGLGKRLHLGSEEGPEKKKGNLEREVLPRGKTTSGPHVVKTDLEGGRGKKGGEWKEQDLCRRKRNVHQRQPNRNKPEEKKNRGDSEKSTNRGV